MVAMRDDQFIGDRFDGDRLAEIGEPRAVGGDRLTEIGCRLCLNPEGSQLLAGGREAHHR